MKLKSKPKYVIIIDLDVFYFSLAGLFSSLPGLNKYDAISSLGLNCMPPSLKPVYYDTYAHIEMGNSHKIQRLEDIRAYQKPYYQYLWEKRFYPLESGFNGLCIYSGEKIEGKSYKMELNEDKDIEAKCEHIPFNRGLKLAMNPSQIVVYKKGLLEAYLLNRYTNRLKTLFIRNGLALIGKIKKKI